nr:MAG TPA: hypothetical protein [Caudoviricetes sp.]
MSRQCCTAPTRPQVGAAHPPVSKVLPRPGEVARRKVGRFLRCACRKKSVSFRFGAARQPAETSETPVQSMR